MKKRIVIDIKTKKKLELSQEALDKILETATDCIDVDCDLTIKAK